MADASDKGEMAREAARVLRAAGEQIGLALADSQPSVEALGESLRRLADLLGADPGAAGGPSSEQLQDLRAEMTLAIRSLQFHDRLTQHLSHVSEYLATSADQVGVATGLPKGPWASLHQRLAERLLSETQRMHLGRNFPAAFIAERRPRDSGLTSASMAGDVELF